MASQAAQASAPPIVAGSSPRVFTSRGRNTRNALLVAARDVFARDGFYDARITDITRRAGIAIGSFYTYFGSKEEIFREVATLVLEELAVAPRRDPENASGDPVRDITFATREYLLACSRNAGIARSIWQVLADNQEIRQIRQNLIARGAERGARYIRRLQKAGMADPEVEPEATAEALQGAVINLAYDKLVLYETGEDIEHLVTVLTRIWVRAVGIEP